VSAASSRELKNIAAMGFARAARLREIENVSVMRAARGRMIKTARGMQSLPCSQALLLIQLRIKEILDPVSGFRTMLFLISAF